MLAVVLLAGDRLQKPWWDNASDIKEMSDAMADGKGNEGIDEYVPAGTDPYDVDKAAPRVTAVSGAAIKAQVTRWSAEDRQFIVHTEQQAILVVRLFDYPAWKTKVNGVPVTTGRSEGTGQLLIPVSAGRSEVEVHFTRTGDRLLGVIVSLFTVVFVVILWLSTKKSCAPGSRAFDAR
jgi:hypothetical protein